jgi:hypothetical protein
MVPEGDPLLFAEFQQLCLGKIRMGFNLNNGRFDPCRIVDGQEILESLGIWRFLINPCPSSTSERTLRYFTLIFLCKG